MGVNMKNLKCSFIINVVTLEFIMMQLCLNASD